MQGGRSWLGSDSAIAKGASIGAGSAVRSAKDQCLQIVRLATYQVAFAIAGVMKQVYSQEIKNTVNNFSKFAVVIFDNYSDYLHIVVLFLGQVNVNLWADSVKKMATVSLLRFRLDSTLQTKVFHAITCWNYDKLEIQGRFLDQICPLPLLRKNRRYSPHLRHLGNTTVVGAVVFEEALCLS